MLQRLIFLTSIWVYFYSKCNWPLHLADYPTDLGGNDCNCDTVLFVTMSARSVATNQGIGLVYCRITQKEWNKNFETISLDIVRALLPWWRPHPLFFIGQQNHTNNHNVCQWPRATVVCMQLCACCVIGKRRQCRSPRHAVCYQSPSHVNLTFLGRLRGFVVSCLLLPSFTMTDSY